MNIGDKIYTEKFVGVIDEILDNDMYGITFNNRNDREVNYNIVSIRVIEDLVAQKEWYVDNDPF